MQVVHQTPPIVSGVGDPGGALRPPTSTRRHYIGEQEGRGYRSILLPSAVVLRSHLPTDPLIWIPWTGSENTSNRARGSFLS